MKFSKCKFAKYVITWKYLNLIKLQSTFLTNPFDKILYLHLVAFRKDLSENLSLIYTHPQIGDANCKCAL